MNKITSLILLAGGIALLVVGFSAFQSIGSDLSRLFTGSTTDKSIWLLFGGAILAAIGAGGFFGGERPI